MRARFKQLTAAFTLSLTAFAGSVSATELALIISNSDYDNLQGERRISRNHRDLVAAFKAQGYEVIEGVDLNRLEMQALVQRVESVIPELAGIVVLCSTNTATNGEQTWILPTDIGGDTAIEAAFGAPTLDLFLSLAAKKPGHGSVFLGVADVDTSRGSNLRAGVGDANIPQGVLLVSGPSDRIASLLEDRLLVDNQPLSVGLSNPNGISVSGFVSPDSSLAPAPADPSTPTSDWVDFVAEQALWAVADKSDRTEDFEEYLRRFPNGVYAPAARARLADVDPVITPPTPAEIEAALSLSRDERRVIQSNLTLLGFDTRGVDGILGRGSRAAIAGWQDSQRFTATGYLTDPQISRLHDQSAAERAIQEAADRRFWNAVGASGRKDDLQAYLDRYPSGIYSDRARELLEEYEAEERTRLDNTAWSAAVSRNTADSYREYLKNFPEGIYASVAKQRIKALDPEDDRDDNAAKAAEDRLNLNVATRLLIENRLRSAGFDPGRSDGVFDDKTRKAIRKYQKARGLRETGYIDPSTVRALLLG